MRSHIRSHQNCPCQSRCGHIRNAYFSTSTTRPRQKPRLQFSAQTTKIKVIYVQKKILVKVISMFSGLKALVVVAVTRVEILFHSWFLEWSGVRAHHPEALVGWNLAHHSTGKVYRSRNLFSCQIAKEWHGGSPVLTSLICPLKAAI